MCQLEGLLAIQLSGLYLAMVLTLRAMSLKDRECLPNKGIQHRRLIGATEDSQDCHVVVLAAQLTRQIRAPAWWHTAVNVRPCHG